MPASDTVRTPRLLVLANGVVMAGAMEAVVTSTGFFSADTFRVRAALLSDAPAWLALPQILIDVQMTLSPDAGFVSVVQGYVDHVAVDPIGGTLTLEGRDRSASLIEARTQETFANRSAAEIVGILAARHGLTAVVDATGGPVGRYWELEHDRVTLNVAGRATTEWDLLVTLAQQAGFDLWVSGTTLNFRAPSTLPPVRLNTTDVSALRLERALGFAGDIVVTVKSWHSRAGSGCVQRAQTTRGAAQSRSYVFVAPNLTQDAALNYATQKLAELSTHELTAVAEMPGELTLAPRSWVLLQGTGTLFDTKLRIDEIERRMHATRGFSQSLRLRGGTALS